MHLGALRMFCDLVETRSFDRAAERHGVTTSAICQMLHNLERDARAQLILRSRHLCLCTPAGETYHWHAREILRLAGELDRQMAPAKFITGGTIDLGTCFSIGLHQLPPLARITRCGHSGSSVWHKANSLEMIRCDRCARQSGEISGFASIYMNRAGESSRPSFLNTDENRQSFKKSSAYLN